MRVVSWSADFTPMSCASTSTPKPTALPRAVSAFIALPSRSTCASTSCRPLEEAIWEHAAEMVSSCLPTARACGSSVTVVRKEARRASQRGTARSRHWRG